MSKLSFTRNAVRITTVITMVAIVAIATADGFAQSYSGLYEWALLHKLTGWKAESFPLLVDLFILVGELGLFLLAIDGYRLRKSFLSWMDIAFPAAVAAAGWGVSLWFNVNHIPNASTEDKVTAGVPPVAAMVGLFILLRTVHRYMSQLDESESSPKVTAEIVPEIGSLSGFPIPSLEDQSQKALSGPETTGPVPEGHPSGTVTDEPEDEPQRPVGEAEADVVRAMEVLLDKIPEPDPEPTRTSSNNRTAYGKGPGHPKWDEGVKIYRESLNGPGKPMSQRDLAAALGMRNRSLAANIIRHVNGGKNSGNVNGVSSPTEATETEEGQA